VVTWTYSGKAAVRRVRPGECNTVLDGERGSETHKNFGRKLLVVDNRPPSDCFYTKCYWTVLVLATNECICKVQSVQISPNLFDLLVKYYLLTNLLIYLLTYIQRLVFISVLLVQIISVVQIIMLLILRQQWTCSLLNVVTLNFSQLY